MQVFFNNTIQQTYIPKYQKQVVPQSITTTATNAMLGNYNITFNGSGMVQKTISSKIAHGKDRLLRHFKEILSLQVPVLTDEEKTIKLIQRARANAEKIIRKEKEIERSANLIFNNNKLSLQQKIDGIQQLKKEHNRLYKIKLKDIEEKQPAKDNYDYALINKFKTAVMNDNFDLAKISEEHYRELENIQTVEEFKEKYPAIRIPANPKDIIVQKILNTLDRNFYYDLDELFITGKTDIIANQIMKFFENYFEKLSKQFKNLSKEDLINSIGINLSRKVLEQYEKLKVTEDFDVIPERRPFTIAQISTADKEMLSFDYDKLVIGTLKQMYLEGKKPNQIEYTENGKTINIGSIKATDYIFEKIPEKIKRLITDAQKPHYLQTDYKNFTTEELKSRLSYYNGTAIGNNEEIFDLIVDFHSCKFTEEDKQYLIRFLQTLDKINNNTLTLKEGIKLLQENNIHPHGTVKLNEIERLKKEKEIKAEQKKQLVLNELRKLFDNTINKLYELNLSDIAETFNKYYPENYDETAMSTTKKIIERINNSLTLKDKNKIRTQLLRWEIYDDYLNNNRNSLSFSNANIYAQNFKKEEKETKIGQYLINREIIENYPDSTEMYLRPKILEKVIGKFGDNKDIATILLCKYEDYISLEKGERQSINSILRIFDEQNINNKFLLKEIIENDYINTDTSAYNTGVSSYATISAKAKKEIFEKYKFPNCIALFESFENALTSNASLYGTAGIKKTGSNNNSLEYKMELKIMGYPDRLFSSQNNYYFDIYSERGLH